MEIIGKKKSLVSKDVFWDSWYTKYWRPAMAWQYLVICLFDLMIMPIIFLAVKGGIWEPMTLKGGGLYHVAMGAIVGVTAWTRGQEKISSMAIAYGQNAPFPPNPYYQYPPMTHIPPPQFQSPTQPFRKTPL